VHAPHRSSPTLTQSLSVPAPRSTPTVHSHHRPSPLRLFTTHHVHRYGPPVTSLRHTTLFTVRSSRTHTTTVHTTWHRVPSLSVHTDHLHIQPAPHGHSLNNRLLLTSLSLSTTICSSQISQLHNTLSPAQLHNTLSPGSSSPLLHKPLEIKLDLLLN
jgi:hypothetical protein